MKIFQKAGFTIVELLISVSIIGVLASFIAINYGGWQRSIAETQIKNDLNFATTAMDNALNFQNAYPFSIPSTFKNSDGTLVRGGSLDGKSFCIKATHTRYPDLWYHIESDNKAIQEGTCPPTSKVASQGDGSAGRQGAFSWTNLRGYSAALGVYLGDQMTINSYSYWNEADTETQYGLRRGYLSFDTSFLKSAVIDSASISLHSSSVTPGTEVFIVAGSQDSTETIVTTDYSKVGSVSFGSATPSSNSDFTINLNAAGIAAINRSGWTKFAIREGHDLNNAMPGDTFSATLFTSESATTSFRPYLVIYHTP